MKWAVDFPSRIRGRPWLQYTVTAETADEARSKGYTALAADGEHKDHYRQPKAVKLREEQAA